ncbi:MAG: molybdopterin converting factor subunit 1 [Pseudomonadales bacterium]
MLEIRYFASLREQLGVGQESVPHADIETVEDLIEHLVAAHGESWREPLTSPQLRIAVNQELIEHETTLADGDEVAFLPPVTGG